MNLRKTLAALLLGALALISAIALGEGQTGAGLSPSALSRSGRQFTYVIPQLRTQTSPNSATCTITTGTVTAAQTWYPGVYSTSWIADGFVHVGDMSAGPSSVTQTGDMRPLFSAIGQPSRLIVDFYDASSDGTLVCSYLTLRGFRWDGAKIEERVASLEETTTTPRYTANAFSEITGYDLVGCSGFSTGDQFRLRVSPWIALPVKINSSSDIDAICVNQTAVVSAGQPTQRLCQKGTAFSYDIASNTVMVLDAGFSPYLGTESTSTCQADRLFTTIRGRASPLASGF